MSEPPQRHTHTQTDDVKRVHVAFTHLTGSDAVSRD